MNLPTTGKSELLGFQYRLVGFLHLPHPVSGKMQVTFFEQLESPKKRWLFCFSDVSNKQAKQFSKILKQQLGKIVGSGEVIPYVQRSLDGVNYNTFKEIVSEGFDSPATWWTE